MKTVQQPSQVFIFTNIQFLITDHVGNSCSVAVNGTGLQVWLQTGNRQCDL